MTNSKDLILLHGGSHGSWCWSPLIDALERSPPLFGRVIALDTPGAGTKRGRDCSRMTVLEIARELNHELRAAGIERATFAGHSLAGVLMPVMAAEDPSLFADLVFLQTSAPLEGQTILEQMAGIDSFATRPDENSAARFRRLFGVDLDQERWRWLLGELGKDATPAALANEPITRRGYDPAKFHTAYILAQRDPVLPPDWQRRFAQRLGCQQIVEIDTPHEPFISHPQLLIDTLRTVLSPKR